jgi:hypothetical protein
MNESGDLLHQNFRKCGEPHVYLGVRGDLFTSVAPYRGPAAFSRCPSIVLPRAQTKVEEEK